MSHHDYYRSKYWRSTGGWSPADVTDIDPRLAEIFRVHFQSEYNLLDVGCGNGGHYGRLLRSLIAQYWGVDISLDALQQAKSIGIDTLQCSIDQPLPFASGWFDAVVCIEVLEHLFDPAALAQEIHRTLKPGGCFIATVPNIAHFSNRLRLAGGKFVAGGSPLTADTPWLDPHIRFFTRRSLTEMLQSTGFILVIIVGMDAGILTDFPILSVALKRLLGAYRLYQASTVLERLAQVYAPLFAGHLVAVCRKPETL